jgi:hypothetical protein
MRARGVAFYSPAGLPEMASRAFHGALEAGTFSSPDKPKFSELVQHHDQAPELPVQADARDVRSPQS